MENTNQQPQMTLLQRIQNTPIRQIIELPEVANKCIQNFAFGGHGDMQKARMKWDMNMIFLRQRLAEISNVDPFSVYACLCTIYAYNYSAKPDDEEIYLVPFKGKLNIVRQAGAHVKRLTETGQIKRVINTSLVYQGDTWEVENKIIKKHVENFKSDRIIAGYVKFELPDGKEKHVIFRRSDWESWRSKSPQPNSDNWLHKTKDIDGTDIEQPMPGFLKNKILAHACKDKGEGWVPGQIIGEKVEVYQEFVNDGAADDQPQFKATQMSASDMPEFTPTEEVKDENIVEPDEIEEF